MSFRIKKPTNTFKTKVAPAPVKEQPKEAKTTKKKSETNASRIEYEGI